MADRILIGKNVNSNHGHSGASPGYGYYISKPSKNVLSCTADELILNTDDGASGAAYLDKGLFYLQTVASTSDSTVSASISSGASANFTIADAGYGFGITAFSSYFSGAYSSGGTGGTGYGITLNSTSSTTINITNNGGSTQTFTMAAMPVFSSSALF